MNHTKKVCAAVITSEMRQVMWNNCILHVVIISACKKNVNMNYTMSSLFQWEKLCRRHIQIISLSTKKFCKNHTRVTIHAICMFAPQHSGKFLFLNVLLNRKFHGQNHGFHGRVERYIASSITELNIFT